VGWEVKISALAIITSGIESKYQIYLEIEK
jgi:hypothetical protein